MFGRRCSFSECRDFVKVGQSVRKRECGASDTGLVACGGWVQQSSGCVYVGGDRAVSLLRKVNVHSVPAALCLT
jgi:hypothetical protein